MCLPAASWRGSIALCVVSDSVWACSSPGCEVWAGAHTSCPAAHEILQCCSHTSPPSSSHPYHTYGSTKSKQTNKWMLQDLHEGLSAFTHSCVWHDCIISNRNIKYYTVWTHQLALLSVAPIYRFFTDFLRQLHEELPMMFSTYAVRCCWLLKTNI